MKRLNKAVGKHTPPEVTEEAPAERPEWLDEKFETPEDMAKAYQELQKKLSQPKETSDETQPTEPETETTSDLNTSISQATEEFAESGELSDATFEALEKAGLPRSFVEQYINGQQAVSAQQASEIKNAIGGDDNYKAMSDWAVENLSEGELDAFNSIVEGQSVEQARIAVKGLYSQFLADGGKSPSLVQGTTSGASVQPFGSVAQLTEAMGDKRYANDPDFRAQVEKRLAVSNIL